MAPDVSVAWAGAATGAMVPGSPLAGGVAALFPIRVVARLTGINPVTIRAWERRYRLVRPERTPGGHRLYSRADVERLRAASRLVERGVSISRATHLLNDPSQRRESRDDRLLDRFLERLHALDDDGMSAVFEASLARRPTGATASLLDELPALAHDLPRLERQFLDAWLEGLLAFRSYQRMAQAGERRVLVCSPGDRGERTWALAFALGLVGSGLRPALLAAPETSELLEAARRTGCAAAVLGGTGRDWPGLAPGAVPAPAFLENAQEGFLPLGDDLDDARRRVVEYLRNGHGQP
jgi:MerR family transcriptional regulator, light-induced transcriptional regulator